MKPKIPPTQLVRVEGVKEDPNVLDGIELGEWLQLELMDKRERGHERQGSPVHYWLRIGQRCFEIQIEPRNGDVTMTEQGVKR